MSVRLDRLNERFDGIEKALGPVGLRSICLGDERLKQGHRSAGSLGRVSRGRRPAPQDRFDAVRGGADVRWRTDELMQLLRSDD